jgi:hypothetical protein
MPEGECCVTRRTRTTEGQSKDEGKEVESFFSQSYFGARTENAESFCCRETRTLMMNLVQIPCHCLSWVCKSIVMHSEALNAAGGRSLAR